MSDYRILVTGSRDWSDAETVRAALEVSIGAARLSGRIPVVVHGACPSGADWIVDRVAEELGVEAEPHPALWREHGRKAGPIRNQEMVDLGADVCLAFIRGRSRGATHCAQRAEAAGIPVRWWRA